MTPRPLPPYGANEDDRSGVRARDSEPPPTARSHTGRTDRPPPPPERVDVSEPASVRALATGLPPRDGAVHAPSLPTGAPASFGPLVLGAACERSARLHHLLSLAEVAARTLPFADPHRRLLEMAMMRRDAALLESVLRGVHRGGGGPSGG